MDNTTKRTFFSLKRGRSEIALASPELILRVALPYVGSRVLIVALILFGAHLTAETIPAREGAAYHLDSTLHPATLWPSLARVWNSADGFWYLDIARHGYPGSGASGDDPQSWVFFPLYPLAIRVLASITGSYLWSAVTISWASFFCGLVLLSKLAAKLGMDENDCRRMRLLLCLFPTSYFFTGALSEALFFALIVGCYLKVEEGSLIVAGLLHGLAAACRPTGMLIWPAFLVALARHRGSRLERCIAAGLGISGTAIYATYLHLHVGQAAAFLDNQRAWGRGAHSFFELVGNWSREPGALIAPWNFVLFNGAIAIVALASAAVLALRFRVPEYALVLALPICAALATGTVQSIARFSVVLFPFAFVLTLAARRERVWLSLIVLCSALLALLCVGYGRHVTAAMA